ncbi:MAG: ABC transporter permease subunit [Candidatus Heimdallarchaeota archaeon]|nr:ABC transporter permease subunit [Candidatus Heimdallarchaeota archaeon]
MNSNRSRERKIAKKKLSMFLIIGSIVLVSLLFQNHYNVSAQSEETSLIEIGDRYAIVNWTCPSSSIYHGFRIDYYDVALNQSFTWSMVILNDTQDITLEYFSQVNYSIGDETFISQKFQTSNFSIYLVDEGAETIQTRITGLEPTSLYSISLHLVNVSLTSDQGDYLITTESEVQYWESEQFETLLSFDDNLEYSKLATSLSLLVIVIIFVAIFFFIAKRDIPFNKIAYIFIFPALLALVLLEVYPILYGIFLSFTDYSLQRGETPVLTGFDNYAHIAENPQLPITFTTTLVWSVLIIVAKIILGFILAYIIQYKVKRKKLWYLMLYIPWAIPSYIKILSWRTFIHGNGSVSLFNTLFGTNFNLLTQPYATLFIACFVEVWDSIPLITTLFLGGLSSIPKEINDLAEIDQISEGTKIRKVIVPLIKPIILPAIILEIIKTFGSFNVAFLLTKGYPLLSYGTSEAGVIGATDLFSTFTFYMFYERRDIGIAAAYSTIMSLLTLFFVLVWLKMSRGTQSTFNPEKKKSVSKNRSIIIVLFFLQAIGYLVAGIFGFRYFGIYWNPYLNYILAGLYFTMAIFCIVIKSQVIKTVRYILLLDLILALMQFFFYQMWYAFNWNIFIIVAEMYILSNIQLSKIPFTLPELLERVKTVANNAVKKIKNVLYKIDQNLITLSPLHVIVTLQTIFIFLSAFTIEANIWLVWLIFGVYVTVLCASLFSKIILKTAIILQPLLWCGFIFSNVPMGWTVILSLLSLAYILGAAKIYQKGIEFLNSKILKLINYIAKPRFNSILFIVILLVTLLPFWNVFGIALSNIGSLVPIIFSPDNFSNVGFSLLSTQEQVQLNFLNPLLIFLGSAILCFGLTALADSDKSKIQKLAKNILKPRNITIFLVTILLVTLLPLWNIFWIAFSKGDSLVPTSFFPDNPTLENFTSLFTQEQIHLNFLNSLLISLGSATLCVGLTSLAAYAFSRYTFTGKKEIMVGVFTLKMFTGILTLIPFFLIMYNMGLIDSYFGIILAYSTHTIPLALWVIKGYMDSIPKELDESATLMGNSKFRVLRKIILPLAGPAIAITFLLSFLRTWNGFLLAFVLLQSPAKYTLPIKIFTFVGSIESSSPEWGLFAAASILVVIPLLIIFVFLRNYLLSGFGSSTNIREI